MVLMDAPFVSEAKGRCNFCHKHDLELVETRDGWHICESCAKKFGFCEICGSTMTQQQVKDQAVDNQLHYEEECFK